jgi:uncharacterized protein YndB with AHSA1/START domain
MPDIHHSINIQAAPEIVIPLVSTADGLRQWWAEDIEAEPDGTVCLGFFNRATSYRLRLIEPGSRRVRWRCETGREWQGTDLTFGLQDQASGVLLDFVHANWREATPYFTSCNTTWGGLMFRLKNAAEGRPQGPLFRRDSVDY